MTSIGKDRARRLRSDPSEAEKRLWSRLRRRQVPIGPYFADFASHDARLVVEVDGGQHATNIAEDRRRTRRMEADGYQVIRFWNDEVLRNTDDVVQAIYDALSDRVNRQRH